MTTAGAAHDVHRLLLHRGLPHSAIPLPQRAAASAAAELAYDANRMHLPAHLRADLRSAVLPAPEPVQASAKAGGAVHAERAIKHLRRVAMNDLSAKRELAIEAKDILESKAFEKAKADLKDRLVNTLVTTAATTEKKLELVAQIKVIDEIVGQLRALINEYNAGVRAQSRGAV
jgi:hypothetical protein